MDVDFSQPPDFAKLRIEYSQRSLSEGEVAREPMAQFVLWLNEAIAAGAREPNGMTLATCGADGAPSARVVLLKAVDARGFAFFTNYHSRKGADLHSNPRAALVFWWPELERQVRVEGTVCKTSQAESDAYFATRPPSARLGAAASPQSEPVDSRQVLVDRDAALRLRFPDGDVPRPAHWGGYRLAPERVEFWQGRPSRLHDRIEYISDARGWTVRRLAL